MNKIQMVDLTSQHQHIKSEIDFAIQNVIMTSSFINGPAVKEFAFDLAKYLDVKHVIPCANGTDALQISLMALDLPKGSEIMVPAFTYIATVEVAKLLGYNIVLVDVDSDTFCIDIEDVKRKITTKTSAIVPVHLFGQCAGMDKIMELAELHGLKVIEDTAQAIGAEYQIAQDRKAKAGTIGHIGTLSFFPSKNLGCFGDGGAILTNDDILAEKCKMIANHGQSGKYIHDSIGCNSRLDTIQAAVLKVKLKYIEHYKKSRSKVAQFYFKNLKNIEGIKLPSLHQSSTHVFNQFTLQLDVDPKFLPKLRDELKNALAEVGIPSMIYYPMPIHYQKAYKSAFCPKGSIPVSEQLCHSVLSLPIHTEMKTEQLEYIVENLKMIWEDLLDRKSVLQSIRTRS
jgi:dTDP-4-amino-4,6-dideoxygalactose transaminase